MTPVMLECGHAANATDGQGNPCCAICFMSTPAASVPASSAPDLSGRLAKCGCGAKKPSSPSLAFFEFRGPGSRTANDTCKCGYALAAHDPIEMARNVPSNRCTVVELGKCKGFEPRGAYEFDSFYCGCRGWD
jgi:hypothetical protein